MNSFVGLYNFLQTYNEDILEWLDEKTKNFEKQESLFRLFVTLGLIPKINKDYYVCSGNYNERTIKKLESLKDFFYDGKNKEKKLKDKGDISDLTLIHKYDKETILACSSKNLNKTNIGKLDISNIRDLFRDKYENKGFNKLVFCIVIRNKKDFRNMLSRVATTNKHLLDVLNKSETIIIDWNDLNTAYKLFKTQYIHPLKEILNNYRDTLVLKPHQEMSVCKTLKIRENNNSALWGHVQRSGKSYIIAGCISRILEEGNYLLITTAPNETIEQYMRVFDYQQFSTFNVILLDGCNKKPILTKKNIIVCSKQFLHKKIEDKNSISWLKKMKFIMRFIDESHQGGTTELAKNILDYYGKDAFTVYISATYSKPVNDYNIPKDCWIMWDMEDISLCKNIHKIDSRKRLLEKHGDTFNNIINTYSEEYFIEEYSKYPELFVLTDELTSDSINTIRERTQDNSFGWSVDGLFVLKQNVDNVIPEFQDEKHNLELWYRIFGKVDEFGIPDKNFKRLFEEKSGEPSRGSFKNPFMKRIENICKNPVYNSRFVGNSDNPIIVMAFLPVNDIDNISIATRDLLLKYKIVEDYEIVIINSKNTNNPKKEIYDGLSRSKSMKKQGVLVLSGKQCSLGVSLEDCDVVLLLNNIKSYDILNQMMFRSMTETKGKKCGFVVDLNIHRCIQLMMESALYIKKGHPKDSIKYILKNNIININPDYWMETFGKHKEAIDKVSEYIYEIYSLNPELALDHLLNRLVYKNIELKKKYQDFINKLFKTGKTKTKIDVLELEETINKGIDKEKCEKSSSKNEDTDEEEKYEEKVNFMDIIKHLIPLLCIFTIRNKDIFTFQDMYNFILGNNELFTILTNQLSIWSGIELSERKIKMIIKIYRKYIKEDMDIDTITRTIKELFVKNISNRKELSSLLDKYLIPQELEKKQNAEVSTPYKLRQEMLDKIPTEFWSKKHKVFEPCCGKGGFLLDIIDRFMDGLKEKIPDEKERYKTIITECLYWSDINPTNIYICKLLLDPFEEYTKDLKYNEGNTLELDIIDKWGVENFDAVIGNPPYNNSQNNIGKKGGGDLLWNKFVIFSLSILKSNKYLCFVHPSGWRKPESSNSKYKNLFKLMTHENQMEYLEIHSTKDGLKVFNCGTRYDWYVIKKKYPEKKTIIIDEIGIKQEVNLQEYDWIPNYNIIEVKKLLKTDNEKNCEIIYSGSSYESRKKWVSKVQTEEFKYPLIHSTPKNSIRYMFSKVKDKGHFGIPKIIFGDSGIIPVIDIEGKYGMTQHSMAIPVSSLEEAQSIEKFISSNKFKKIINSCSWSNFQIDWRLFTYFKKDFWKENI